MAYYIGIDLGTSAVKMLMMDNNGEIIKSVSKEYPLYFPQAGWSEQNPEDWWQACLNGIKDVVKNSKVNASDIKGIGLSGQMHGLVLVDKDCNVIRNSIIWCDQRTEKQCRNMDKSMGRYRITGKDTAERLKEDRACSKALKYSILRKDSFMNKKITEEGNEGNYI